MNPSIGIRVISYFFAFALFFQSLEMIAISRNSLFLKIWQYSNIQDGFSFFKIFFSKIYSKRGFQAIVCFQLLLILSVFVYFNPFLIFFIALIQLIICMRFRGNFNGGSDMMIFVIATGLIIGGKFGLIYIAIHTTYSYFKAGLAKIVQPDWRSGLAIGQFLESSLYPEIRQAGKKLILHKEAALALSLITLIFEISIPFIFVVPDLGPFYFIAATLFHSTVFIFFGLNRFFFIWLAAWPAVLFCLNLIKF